ncbi:MAG: UDP-N-acetylmuramate dehydrogenase [Lachnospiraceae bacterium]|uniref:UDP-N-acetylmuramate dehydrogenase n=1 Tax=Lacrimispora indolis TaxID=69825 RepID=UPI0030230B56
MKQAAERLKQAVGAGIFLTDEPMSRHTTFRTGGPADIYIEPSGVEELKQVLDICREENVAYTIIGNGSNLLVGDGGYRGVLISFGKPFAQVTIEGAQVRTGAGALLSAVAKQVLNASLTGFEFAAGIPGTIGGAVVMNAGAYGGELCQVLREATVLTPEGEVKTLPAEELELGYRTSCVQKNGYIVLEAVLQLQPGNADDIRAVMDALASKRREKQPLEYPSAGSTFKRPEGHFAGRLIQDAGLRGFRVGGAQVSEKHCGFVINRDHATSADILSLCRQVQEKVKAQFGVELELEVKLLGEF